MVFLTLARLVVEIGLLMGFMRVVHLFIAGIIFEEIDDLIVGMDTLATSCKVQEYMSTLPISFSQYS